MENFSTQMDQLYQSFINTESFTELSEQPSKILFLSLGYREKGAVVFSANRTDFKEAWKSLSEQAFHYLALDPGPVEFMKLDWVDSQTTLSIPRFIELISKAKRNHFRYGLSFDPQFKYAFLEQEVHANGMIQFNRKTGRAFLHGNNIKSYIAGHRPGISRLDLNEISSVTIFTTKSIFLENDQSFVLKNDRLNNGRRNTAFTLDKLEKLISGGLNYLTVANRNSGKFIYGYYPTIDKEIDRYSMLHHSNALYAMLEAYGLLKNENSAHAIKKGLDFLVEHGLFIDDNAGFAYVVDQVGDKDFEAKLGANAAAILAIVKYTEIFGDRQYLRKAGMLARGIARLQKGAGDFIHTLHFPSLEIKEGAKISSYETQAVLALLKLYSMDRDQAWLESAERAFDYFTEHDYWKKPDHWLAASVNEMMKVRPSQRYFQLGIRLISARLNAIDKQEMIYPALFRLILEGYKLLKSQKEKISGSSFKDFEQKLIDVIYRRAEYQRNGYFYPELAIYFKNPERIIDGFFNRYQSFRIRIDELADYLSGYCNYYELFFAEEKHSDGDLSDLTTDSEKLIPIVDSPEQSDELTDFEDVKEVFSEQEIPNLETSKSARDSKKRPKETTAKIHIVPEVPGKETLSDMTRLAGDIAKTAIPSAKRVVGAALEDSVEFLQTLKEKKAARESEKAVLNLANQVLDFSQRMESLTKEVAALSTKSDRLEKSAAASSDVQALSKELSDLTAELTAMKKQAEDLEKKHKESAETSVGRSEVTALSGRLTEITAELSAIKEQMEQFAEKQTSIWETAASASEVQTLLQDVTELTKELAALKKQAEELEEQQRALTEASAAHGAVSALSERLSDITSELSAVRIQTEELEEKQQGSARCEQVDALSERLSKIASDLTALKGQTEELADKQASLSESAANTKEVQSLSQELITLTNELSVLKNQAKVLEEKQKTSAERTDVTALSDRLSEIMNELTSVRIRTEELAEKQTVVSESAARTSAVQILSQELTQLTKELSALRNQANELEDKQKTSADRDEVSTLSDRLSEVTVEFSALSNRFSAMTSELTTLKNQTKELQEKQISFPDRTEVTALSERLSGVAAELSALKAKAEEFADKQMVLSESAERTSEVQSLSDKLTELSSGLSALKNQAEELEAKQKTSAERDDVVALTDRLSEVTIELSAVRERTEELAEKQAALSESAAQTAEVQKLSQELADLTKELSIVRKLAVELEEKQKDSADRTEVIALSDGLSKLTIELETLRNEAEALTEKQKASAEIFASRDEVDTFFRRLSEITAELSTLKNQAQESERQIRQESSFATKQLESLTVRISEIATELTAVKKRAEEHGKQTATQFAETTEQIKSLTRQVTDLTNKLDSLKKKAEEIEQALLNIEKYKEDKILEAVQKVLRIDTPEGVTHLKGIVREIVKQLAEEETSEEELLDKPEDEEEEPDSDTADSSTWTEEPPSEELADAEEAESEAPVEMPPKEKEIEQIVPDKRRVTRESELEKSTVPMKEVPVPSEEEAELKDDEPAAEAVPQKHEEKQEAKPADVPKKAEEQEAQSDTKEKALTMAKPKTDAAPAKPAVRDKKKLLQRIGNVLIIIGVLVTGYFIFDVVSMKWGEHQALKEAESKIQSPEKPAPDSSEEEEKLRELIENYQAKQGEAFATLEIPKLDKKLPILEGTDPDTLDKGVGHLKESVFPGQNEQIVISGHRDTVFRKFENLEIGDKFIIHMPYGTYTYEMRETEIVDKDDTSVVRSMGEEVLVVTTCYPFYYIGSAPDRFVIYAYPVENEEEKE